MQDQQAAGPSSGARSHDRSFDLIATDVDGTLLNSSQKLTQRTEQAIKRAAELGVPTVVATGKNKGPWSKDILPRLGPQAPGVFTQGLLVYAADGSLIHSKSMDPAVAAECIRFGEEHGLSVVAYSDDRIVCSQRDEHTDRLMFYGEPTPEAVGPLTPHLDELPMQKFIYISTQERIDAVRPTLQELLSDRAHLTSALTGMLEVLPPGANKAAGLKHLLEHMDIRAERVMAVGDGENDIEMLQLAGLGVAMGNAGEKTKAAAQEVTGTNDQDGLAEAIEKHILQPAESAVAA